MPWIRVLKQRDLAGIFRRKIHHDHPGLLILVALSKDHPKSLKDKPGQFDAGVSRVGELHHDVPGILGQVSPEPVRVHKDKQLVAARMLPAQFFGTSHHIRRDPLTQIIELRVHLIKRTRGGNALPVFHPIHLQGGLPLQLMFQPETNHRHVLPHPQVRQLRELVGVLDPQSRQPFCMTMTDAPHILDRQPLQRFDPLQVRIYDVRTTGLFRELLRHLVGHLRQCLGVSDTHRHRDPGRPRHLFNDHEPVLLQVKVVAPLKIQESLVDAIDLDLGCHRGQQVHHPSAHVAIKRVVRREHKDVVLGESLFILEGSRAHRDAENLGLVRPRNDTAIIVREHHDRFPPEFGPEHPFTRSVEVIAIDQCEHYSVFIT